MPRAGIAWLFMMFAEFSLLISSVSCSKGKVDKVCWIYRAKEEKEGAMGLVIRLATEADLPAINAIYNYYVLNSTCTYQLEPETEEDRLAWFCEHGTEHPVVVAEKEGEVVGWASLSAHKSRCAYANTVESSVYLRFDQHRQGIGRALMLDVIGRARGLGYHTLLAGVSADQTASLGLHESLGFAKVAHYREVGYKFERWLDVVYFQLML